MNNKTQSVVYDIPLISGYTHTHTRLTALFPGLPGWAGTRKIKPIWILVEQEIVSGSGISWACASLHLAPDRKPHQHLTTQFFYRLDALPATQPTASKHWRHNKWLPASKIITEQLTNTDKCTKKSNLPWWHSASETELWNLESFSWNRMISRQRQHASVENSE